MGLSQSDIIFLQTIIKTDYLEQVESAFSILVKNEKFFYKISPDPSFLLQLTDLYHERIARVDDKHSFSHLVLPTNIISTPRGLPIFQFDAQPHQPLSQPEAKKCLGDFVEHAIRALRELHGIGFAHSDVRLPNFCFSDQYEAMLIDFDRAVRILRQDFSCNDPYIFQPPVENVTFEGLDFKQLGFVDTCCYCP
ncbi:hypothetical protein LOD99_11446 [Oopsacas minuta]|uniref:Protein kinase domain-containing protein n=1 Tax=Oopsacas minuta TaxID=111878 RepID=A0AAV7K2N9_9METZ|nr:hypothetical protein LOD99_11446 [Oopsacas minuta]